MKLFKRTAGILLAMVMMVLFTTTAFAEVDVTNRVYEAYQIFAGTQENTDILCDVKWGTNMLTNADKFLEALKKDDLYKDCKTAEDVAKVIANFANDAAKLREFAKLADQFKTGTGTNLGTYLGTNGADLEAKLGAGYYLVVDLSATAGAVDTAKNLSLLQMTKNGEFEIKVKTDIPKVEKKVKEETFTAANQVGNITGYPLETGYNDVADYDIGDDVPFMLIGTMPTTLADYATYKYIFHDTLSVGLTYNDDVKVYFDDNKDNNCDTKVEIKKDDTVGYSVSYVDDKLTISFVDVKSIVDINDNKLDVDKDSTIIVKYTADLNKFADIGLDGNPNEVCLEYSNNPNYEGEGKPSQDTGNTEEDKVIVFTYELDVTKVDSADIANALPNAVFKLMKGDKYYCLMENDSVRWVAEEGKATELRSDVDGMFKVVGLDDGDYTLIEVAAPAGYNAIDPISFTVDATTSNGQEWNNFVPKDALTKLSITVGDENAASENGDANSGIVSMIVKNSLGTILPETGGIGTVAIYTIGSLLVIVAVVLLVTKKRMSK